MSVLTPPAPPQQRGGLLGVIRRRPLLSFFVLALGLSWVAWIPYILSNHGLGVWDFSFPGGSIGGQLLGMLPGAYLGPIGSALLVTAIADGRPGLRTWARRLWNWKVSWKWYVGILLGVPAVMVLAGLVFAGGQVEALPLTVIPLLVVGLFAQMITTGLAEEPGWRDFALPRMQRLVGAPRAALVIGVLWALWHMPLFLTEWGGYPDVPWYRPVMFTLFCVTFNVVMSWVFNKTGQSLPMAMLLHVGINNFASVAWSDLFPGMDRDTAQAALLLGSTVVGAIVMAGSRGRLGYHPEPQTEPVPVPAPLPEPARLS
ncbi:CPBP family intramembrane glutamic endopeptidase [Cellulomonas sp. KH9]|uniref:CPBP family intramembrane glutamic endopeptidase n=1 Tax=Cellulomonas sp. KH9 TaxID=1855324 RepID=UPI0008E26B98|nr:CPBP family intramembrane glutamic endopeptidase [Cellulomonas sp. KH9]SFK42666.1 CAAX protease self-immunity [Cellulomonas sp. KH9]